MKYTTKLGLSEYIFQDITNSVNFPLDLIRIFRMFIQSRAEYILPLFRFCNYPGLSKVTLKLVKMRYNSLCDRYSVYLPIETKLGTRITFPHNFPLIINPAAIIGDGCIIHPCVLIGRDRGKIGAPTIGNNCFIGHGAKIIGNPNIGDWTFIAPGAIVTKDIPKCSIVGAGLNNILETGGGSSMLKCINN